MPRKKKTEAVKEEKAEIEENKTEETAEEKEKKKKELLARAKKLEEEISPITETDIKEDIEKELQEKESKKRGRRKRISKQPPVLAELIVPLEEYVKAGIHLGTKVITGDMRQYVYRRRADGLAILNTNFIDKKMRGVIQFISGYDAKDIILVCKREAGWKAAEKLSEATGIRAFTKKYPAGLITNPRLEGFFEPSLVMICDPWLDKNAIHDAIILGIPIIGLCDTNNLTRNIDLTIPCNNKSNKTLGLVFWILAQGFCKAKGLKFEYKISDFTGESEQTPEKEASATENAPEQGV